MLLKDIQTSSQTPPPDTAPPFLSDCQDVFHDVLLSCGVDCCECGAKRDTGASLPYCTLAKNTDDVFVFLLGYCTLKNKTVYLYLYLV